MEQIMIFIGIGLAFVIVVGTIGYFMFKIAGKRHIKSTKSGRRKNQYDGDNHDQKREDKQGRN